MLNFNTFFYPFILSTSILLLWLIPPTSTHMLPPTFIKLRSKLSVIPACSTSTTSSTTTTGGASTWSSGGGKPTASSVHWVKDFGHTESYTVPPMGWVFVAFTLERAQDILISVVPTTFVSVEAFLTNNVDVNSQLLCQPPDLSKFPWHLTAFAGPMSHYPLVVKASDPRFTTGTYLLGVHAYVQSNVLVTVTVSRPGGIVDSSLPYHQYQGFGQGQSRLMLTAVEGEGDNPSHQLRSTTSQKSSTAVGLGPYLTVSGRTASLLFLTTAATVAVVLVAVVAVARKTVVWPWKESSFSSSLLTNVVSGFQTTTTSFLGTENGNEEVAVVVVEDQGGEGGGGEYDSQNEGVTLRIFPNSSSSSSSNRECQYGSI